MCVVDRFATLTLYAVIARIPDLHMDVSAAPGVADFLVTEGTHCYTRDDEVQLYQGCTARQVHTKL